MGLFSKEGMEKTSFTVEGMTCDHCRKSIEEGLISMTGISEAKVNLKKKQARVTYDPKSVTLEKIGEKVEEIGYKALIG